MRYSTHRAEVDIFVFWIHVVTLEFSTLTYSSIRGPLNERSPSVPQYIVLFRLKVEIRCVNVCPSSGLFSAIINQLSVAIDRCFPLGIGGTTLAAQQCYWRIVHRTAWYPWMPRSESLRGHGVEFRTVLDSLSRWVRVEPISSLLVHST